MGHSKKQNRPRSLVPWAFRRKLVLAFWHAYGKLHRGWRRKYASFITEYTDSEQVWNRECQSLQQTLQAHHPGLCGPGSLRKHRVKYFFCRAFFGAIVRSDYFGHRMFCHGWRFHRKMITNGKIRFICDQLNSPEAVAVCRDKAASARQWNSWYRRGWLEVGPARPVSAGQLEKLLNGKHRLVLKPLDDYGGHGIRVLDTSGQNPEAVLAELNNLKKPGILEEYVEQSGLLHELNPSSLNTVRVITALHRDHSVSIENMYFRIGKAGAVIDNVTSGGREFYVNARNGRIEYGSDFEGYLYQSNPETGGQITGLPFPHFREVLDFCRDAHLHAPDGLRVAGWDVCVSDDGLTLIEVNSTPGFATAAFRLDNHWKSICRLLDEYSRNS